MATSSGGGTDSAQTVQTGQAGSCSGSPEDGVGGGGGGRGGKRGGDGGSGDGGDGGDGGGGNRELSPSPPSSGSREAEDTGETPPSPTSSEVDREEGAGKRLRASASDAGQGKGGTDEPRCTRGPHASRAAPADSSRFRIATQTLSRFCRGGELRMWCTKELHPSGTRYGGHCRPRMSMPSAASPCLTRGILVRTTARMHASMSSRPPSLEESPAATTDDLTFSNPGIDPTNTIHPHDGQATQRPDADPYLLSRQRLSTRRVWNS